MAKGSTLRNALARLKNLHGEFFRDELSDEEVAAIMEHLEGPYQPMWMRNPPVTGYGSGALAQTLDEIIRRAPRSTIPIETYRGTSHSRMIPENRYPLTTSTNYSTAGAYLDGWIGDSFLEDPPVFGTIEMPENSPMLMFDEPAYEARTKDVMPYGDEEEILLPQGPLGDVLEQIREKIVREKIHPRADSDSWMERLYRYKPPFRRGGALSIGARHV